MHKIIFVCLTALCLTLPAFAQKNKVLPAAADAVLARQSAKELYRPKDWYHAVFGYMRPLPALPPHPKGALSAFSFPGNNIDLDKQLFQVAPLKSPLQDVLSAREFVRGEDMTVGQLSQAAYLWRLAHPFSNLIDHTYLFKKSLRAYHVVEKAAASHTLNQVLYLPNVQFLNRLSTVGVISFSYSRLLERVRVYPKHIELNEDGFPQLTSKARLADMLDNYLILSNPREMREFVNAGSFLYTPFVLTKEERKAANELLARRQDSEKLPGNITPRDLIALAYNRLETHAVKYTQIDQADPRTFKAYPNYTNTHLYHSIQGIIVGQWPMVWIENGRHVLKNKDVAHLTVLDAVMGGVNSKDYAHVNRVLESFRELCAETKPTPQNIAHLTVLQKNLRVAFYDLIEYHQQPQEPASLGTSNWHQRHISYAAWDLLQHQDVRELVGINWK